MENTKKRILFVGGRFFPTTSANSLCLLNIARSLVKDEYDVSILATGKEEVPDRIVDDVHIFTQKAVMWNRYQECHSQGTLHGMRKIIYLLLLMIHRIMSMLRLYRAPDVDLHATRAEYCLASKLHQENPFDCVIGVYNTWSNIAATAEMKKKYPHIVCGAYYLDLFDSQARVKGIIRKIRDYFFRKGEHRALCFLDFILIPKSGEGIYLSPYYSDVNGKIRFVEFPLLSVEEMDKQAECKQMADKKCVSMVYAGTLDRGYRNPEYMLQILGNVNRCGGIVIHMYTKGDCDSIIQKYQHYGNVEIVRHGIVSHEEVLHAYNNADIVISIANRFQHVIPSKMFELFATGKPILHFTGILNDPANKYFALYPSVCQVFEWKPVRDQSVMVEAFILAESGKRYNRKQIEEIFIECTPRFTARILEEVMS